MVLDMLQAELEAVKWKTVFEEQRFTAAPMSGPGAGGWLRLRGGFWGTHAYLVTARGAQRLLDSAEPIASQVDAYMGWQAEFDPAFVIHTKTHQRFLPRLKLNVRVGRCCWRRRCR